MDPGTIVGAVSLAFQVFASCVKGCQLLLESKDFPQKYGYLRHRLHWEQLKLLDWWSASGFTIEADFLSPQLDERKQAMIDSLEQIRCLTSDIRRIKERYDLVLKTIDDNKRNDAPPPAGLLLRDSLGTTSARETLRRKSLKYADTFLKYPSRLRWAVFDAAKFEQLLASFSELNNSMHFSLESERRRRHIRLQEATQMQVLLVHDRLDQVMELILSLRLSPATGLGLSQEESRNDTFNGLKRLAQFKALSMAVNEDSISYKEDAAARIGVRVPSSVSLKLTLSQLQFREDEKERYPNRSAGTYNDTAVWIEWKYYDEVNTTLTYAYIENRLARLTALLSKNPDRPEQLPLPTALGYFDDPAATRFGLVFEIPALMDASVPQSLYTRLRTTSKPSLNVRLNMARRLVESLGYLHAMNWLHKGLRSDNILFLTSSSSDWLSYCLSGFDYSRPASPGEVTEPPSRRKEHDLYRHPEVQFDVPRDGEYGYKEEHDIYSIGVVLMEIGLWQPVHEFLGLSLNRPISRRAIGCACRDLLKAESIAMLESEVGERFSEVVKLCLSGNLESSSDRPSSAVNIGDQYSPPQRPIRSLHKAQEIFQGIIL